MTRLRVTYSSDEPAFRRAVEQAVARNQGMFADDVRPVLRDAAAKVIYGNFTGQGASARSPGGFNSPRARSYRGWVEGKHGSSRARRAGQGAPSAQFQQLRNSFLLDAAQRVQAGNPALERLRAEAAKAAGTDPLAGQEGGGFPNLRGFLRANPIGRRLTRNATRRAQHTVGAGAKWGVQTGKLARAWYDLGVSIKSTSGTLHAEFTPAAGRTPGTPDAEKLTAALARQAGGQWRGLMDHAQLLAALKEAGVVVRD